MNHNEIKWIEAAQERGERDYDLLTESPIRVYSDDGKVEPEGLPER